MRLRRLGLRGSGQDWAFTDGSMTSRFAFDEDNVWMDLDGSNTPLVRYLYGVGANQILTRTVGSGANAGPWVYLTDNLGSIRDLVNWSAQVEDHLDYTGYGVVTESNPSVGSRYQFAGYQTDVLTGTDFTIARVYNPATGNWQSQDPLQFQAGDSNLSRYVGNDPVDSVDPSGLAGFTMPNGPYQSQYAPPPGYNVALDILQTDPDDRTLSESWQMFTNRRGLIRMARQLAAKYDYGYKGMRPQAGPPGASAPAQTGPAPQNGGGGMTTNFFEAIPNNGNGGDLLQEVEQIMTSGRPVAAGSLPIYGDGNQNAAQAGGSAGRMIVSMNAGALSAIGSAPYAGAGIAAAGAVGVYVALGEYGNAVMAGLPFLPALLGGLCNAGQWVYGGLTAPGSCSTWNRISSLFQNACFAAGTPLLTPDGSKPIEQFKVGDVLLSRDENDPLGPISPKVVEEVFVRAGQILHVHVRGQVIRTTPEHPFWVNGRGWLPAGCLCVGDLLYSHDGNWVAVEDLYNGGESGTVYNLRVADYHTYFVGRLEWGFSLWAHNADYLNTNLGRQQASAIQKIGNVIRMNLKPGSMGEVAGAVTEMLGGLIPHITKPGQFHNHIEELNNTITCLVNNIKILNGSPLPGAAAAISRAQAALDAIYSAIRGLGI